MLLKYTVSNFKSIGHDIEFSMFPTTPDIEEKYTKTIHTKAGVWKILRRSAFYGPNASGKTSFIESIAFAKKFIVNGSSTGKAIGINLFKGKFDDLEEQAVFQFTFLASDGEVYEYGYSVDNRQVYEEWLMVLTEKEVVPLFTRQTDKNGKTMIEIEEEFAKKDSEDRSIAELLKNTIQEKQKNQLFLYKLYDNGVKKAEPVMEWFQSIQIIFPKTRVQLLPIRISQDTDFKEFVSHNLNKMDTGVVSVSAVNDEMDFYEFADELKLPDELVRSIEEQKHGIFNVSGKYYIFGEKGENKIVLVQIKFEHKLNGESVEFDLEDESDGTRRLLDLLPMLFAMDRKSNNIYFIDEIDRSLHTRLSRYLLKQFLDNSENTKCQMVFTAHDVNLINLDDFAQDEIWFVDKNLAGETEIKPLSDFNIAENQNLLKAYLNGRFGAVPVIKGV